MFNRKESEKNTFIPSLSFSTMKILLYLVVAVTAVALSWPQVWIGLLVIIGTVIVVEASVFALPPLYRKGKFIYDLFFGSYSDVMEDHVVGEVTQLCQDIHAKQLVTSEIQQRTEPIYSKISSTNSKSEKNEEKARQMIAKTEESNTETDGTLKKISQWQVVSHTEAMQLSSTMTGMREWAEKKVTAFSDLFTLLNQLEERGKKLGRLFDGLIREKSSNVSSICSSRLFNTGVLSQAGSDRRFEPQIPGYER